MGALEGSRLQVDANQLKEALVCRESCAADARPKKYEPQDSSLAVLPKSEQQPNAPGLLFWFLLCVREIHRHLRVRSVKAGNRYRPEVLDQRHGLLFRSLKRSAPAAVAKEKSVHFLC